jgi:hypothetical protein
MNVDLLQELRFITVIMTGASNENAELSEIAQIVSERVWRMIALVGQVLAVPADQLFH